MVNKLENPKRVEELSPVKTLKQIGITKYSTFCDIGAGTGIFTYAAVNMTKGNVYSVEISEAMRKILHAKNGAGVVIIEDSIQNVPDNVCDVTLLCTVLHELNNIPEMIREIKRIVKTEGILAVIEFHKTETPMGPPVTHRISEQETIDILAENRFTQISQFRLGDNFYCLVFKKKMEE